MLAAMSGSAFHSSASVVGTAGDDTLSKFVRPDFDAKDFVRGSVRQNTVSDDLSHLRQGIAVLEKQLHEQVVSHHGRLIEQVSQAKDLEELVDKVSSGVGRLQGSLGSIKSSIREPFETVRSKTVQLSRIQTAAEVLRAVIRIRELASRMSGHLVAVESKSDSVGMKDLAHAASCLSEIRACISRCDLAGVEEVDKRRKWLDESEQMIRSKTKKTLLDAVLRKQLGEIGSSLQVFYSLETLQEAVEDVLAELIRLAKSATAAALDTSSLPLEGEEHKNWNAKQRGPTSASGAQAWKTELWSRMETLMETLSGKCGQVWHLHKVMGKKRANATLVLFAEAFDPSYSGEHDHSFFQLFWSRMFQAVCEQLQASGEKNSFVKGMLSTDFPKLLALFLGHWQTSVRHTEAGSSGAIGQQERSAIITALQPLLHQHVAKAQTRVTECVNALFAAKPAGGPAGPQASDVSALLKSVNNIVHSSRHDPVLSREVAAGVVAGLSLLLKRCDDATTGDADARTLTGTLTTGQARSFALHSALLQLEGTLESLEEQLTSSGSTEAAKMYEEVRRQAETRCTSTIKPFVDGMQSAMLDSILNMHLQPLQSVSSRSMDDADDAADDSTKCSPYMQEVLRVLSLGHSKYLSKLPSSRYLDKLSQDLATSVLSALVRNALLAFPLLEGSKMQLIQDLTVFEERIGQHVNLQLLGQHYHTLRALRPLMFVDDEPLESLPGRLTQARGADSLSKHDFLHHMMQRAPAPLPPLFSEPPGPSRKRAIMGYLEELDREGERKAAERVTRLLKEAKVEPNSRAQHFKEILEEFAKELEMS
ncbi:oligomeric Golgi complex subunit 5 [Guillardia theta CCMP2712]|uniref:Conserved oligomeric Golgi complex subunit 5 n=2 Tax=Guillardia theta TaxID=55529 RepID=L1IB39_GUITC|nr:oligomeric Golgi complex subunit 5 [Guillardia theta CCMP2712]EKX33134.1 oligomeric Golgi complex subunit 5 [Guillardia theta CCMP2712]|eukprot:XP_005820114.1 oligomeric Golgi complex subunit 5 [Guillardia theta CCMP2712]